MLDHEHRATDVVGAGTAARGRASEQAGTAMWPVWGAMLATTAMFVGWNWDICWHRSIGRDTLWTLPHLAIYAALLIAFFYNAALVLSYTFGSRKGLPAIKVFGFSGPGGSFVTIWAILAQFTSIVFDDWWHQVYGLDSQVFTPPHFLLGAAIGVFYIGQIIFVSSFANTFGKHKKETMRWVVLLMWTLALGNSLVGADALYGPMGVRTPAFFVSMGYACVFLLVTVREYLNWRWAMVWMAALYMGIVIVMMQIFQLFPATPQFGPVYHHVDRFAPPPFPIFLIVPAATATLAWPLLVGARGFLKFLRHVAFGAIFIATAVVTNLATSAFMASEYSHNRFFAGDYPAAAFKEDFLPVHQIGFEPVTYVALPLAVLVAALAAWAARLFAKYLLRICR